MEFGDGHWQKIGPETFRRLPELFSEELEKVLREAAVKLEVQLRTLYAVTVRERPRNEGEHLKEIIFKAITSAVGRSGEVVDLGVFNLSFAEEATHNETFGTAQSRRSLFAIMEEGSDPSLTHGFIALDEALHLARAAAAEAHLPEEQLGEFLAYVQEQFAGRHGEGIMVEVTRPLFYRFPEFGTPLEHGVLPHPGWEGWHILDTRADGSARSGAARTEGSHWIGMLLEKAVQNTAKRVQSRR